MSLNNNKKRLYKAIIKIYKEAKQNDIPDTFIINKILPKHGIYISYRQWMRIKDLKPSELEETETASTPLKNTAPPL